MYKRQGIAYAGYPGKPASGDSLAVHQILDVDYDNSAIHFCCYDDFHIFNAHYSVSQTNIDQIIFNT